MSFSNLGNVVYNVPTSSTSAVIPDSTLTFSVPIEQMTADAVALAWPNVMARVQNALPSLVAQAVPALQQAAPALVEPVWPNVEPYLDAYMQRAVPAAWATVAPQVRKEIADAVTAEERKAVIGAVLTATVFGAVGVWLWRKFT